MNRAKKIVDKVVEALEAARTKVITASGYDYPLFSWTEGNYECAMTVEPRKGQGYAVTVYGGYMLDKTSFHGLDLTSDWYSRKIGFDYLDAATKFFDEHVKTIKTKGALAETGFPKGWGEFFGITDEVLSGLAAKTEG
jgi:hypothetical protein